MAEAAARKARAWRERPRRRAQVRARRSPRSTGLDPPPPGPREALPASAPRTRRTAREPRLVRIVRRRADILAHFARGKRPARAEGEIRPRPSRAAHQLEHPRAASAAAFPATAAGAESSRSASHLLPERVGPSTPPPWARRHRHRETRCETTSRAACRSARSTRLSARSFPDQRLGQLERRPCARYSSPSTRYTGCRAPWAASSSRSPSSAPRSSRMPRSSRSSSARPLPFWSSASMTLAQQAGLREQRGRRGSAADRRAAVSDSFLDLDGGAGLRDQQIARPRTARQRRHRWRDRARRRFRQSSRSRSSAPRARSRRLPTTRGGAPAPRRPSPAPGPGCLLPARPACAPRPPGPRASRAARRALPRTAGRAARGHSATGRWPGAHRADR